MTGRKEVVGPNKERSRRELAERQRARVEALERFLKAGRIPFNEILRNDKAFVQGLQVSMLLRSLPGIGRVRALWLLETLRVDPAIELGQLPMLRREELIMLLARHFPAVPLSEMTPQQNRERLLSLHGRMPRVARAGRP